MLFQKKAFITQENNKNILLKNGLFNIVTKTKKFCKNKSKGVYLFNIYWNIFIITVKIYGRNTQLLQK